MKRSDVAIGLSLLLLCALVGPAPAQTPPGGPHAARADAVLSGQVTDAAGAPLAGVTVQVFEEGFLLVEAETNADGSYSLPFGYFPDIDWTIIAWFVPPSETLVPEILILRESLKSKSLELWSTCLPRLDLRPQMQYDVQLVDGNTKRQRMSELECLEQ